MSTAKKKSAPRQQQTQQQPRREQPRQVQGEIISVPARIIEEGRKTSHLIIDALANTALAISSGENVGEKLEVIKWLWSSQKEAEDRQAEREFNVAKVLVAQQLPKIPKTGKREFTDKNNVVQSSTYATLDDIEGVLDTICLRLGLIKEYGSKSNDKGWACQVLTIRHISGHKEVYESPYMPLDTSGSKNNQQGAGSVAKYGRRYALIGAFNIYHVDEDTDGAGQQGVAKDDKFGQRVEAEASKQQPPKGPAPLTLPEAAAALESKLRNLTLDKRPEALIKHINVIDAMEKDEVLAPKAAELRKLCEEKTQ